MRRLRVVLSIAAISLLPSAALAQSAEAVALFNEGDALMKQGKLAEACDAFEASHRIEPGAGVLIRLGECREKNHQLASSWSAYRDALSRAKDPKKKEIAAAKVKELEGKLSYLSVQVPEASRVDGLALTRNNQSLDSALWNRAVPVNGGEYTIVARAPGKEDWKTTIKVPNEKGKITVDVPKLVEPGKPKPEPKPIAPPPTEVKPVVEEPPDELPGPSMFTTKRKIALAVGGVAVVGLAAGVFWGTRAQASELEAFTLCPDPMVSCDDAVLANAHIADGRTAALIANISFGVAGAAAIGAAVLWFTGAPETKIAMVPGPGSLTVVGRF